MLIRRKKTQGETLAQEGRAPDRMTRFFTGAPLAPRRPRRRVDTRRNLSPSEQEAYLILTPPVTDLERSPVFHNATLCNREDRNNARGSSRAPYQPNRGTSSQTPPFMADSCASRPGTVTSAACTALNAGRNPWSSASMKCRTM